MPRILPTSPRVRCVLQIESTRSSKVLEAINASHSDGEPALMLLQSALSMSLPAAPLGKSKWTRMVDPVVGVVDVLHVGPHYATLFLCVSFSISVVMFSKA